jgi:hypothetical protein
MDKNDLKSIWYEVHTKNDENIYNKVDIEKTIRMNHSKAISKVLSDVKLKILISLLVLVTFIGLMIYAFLYLKLHLSVNSIIPLTLAGLFLLFKTTSEIKRLFILRKTADNMSVKESMLFFRKKLNKIKSIDFLIYLIFFYLSAIGITFCYIKDIGGVKNLSWSNNILPLPLLLIFILILLFIPWLVRYQHNQSYKNMYSNLNDSANHLNDT